MMIKNKRYGMTAIAERSIVNLLVALVAIIPRTVVYTRAMHIKKGRKASQYEGLLDAFARPTVTRNEFMQMMGALIADRI